MGVAHARNQFAKPVANSPESPRSSTLNCSSGSFVVLLAAMLVEV
jgi:hypothetical protein